MANRINDAPQWVIERTSEFIREWWDGTGWTEDYRRAKWYPAEPDAAALTDEEEARAVNYESQEIPPG